MIKRGRCRLASKERHKYSPSTPSITSWTPDVINTTQISDVHPSTGTTYTKRRTIKNSAYAKPAHANNTPSADMNRIGKYEKPTSQSTDSLIFFDSVHFDRPDARACFV